MGNNIILASQSPRRKQLLEQAEITFVVQVADIDETPPTNLPCSQVPEYLAKKKAAVIAAQHTDAIIIAADTVVILNEKILGKPTDANDAVAILTQLSGNVHYVVSGVCIKTPQQEISFSSTTEVHFKALSQQQIQHYVNQYKPYDKAGAYAIQEWIGMVGIEKIVGDYYNVVGLPINQVVATLAAL